jgi:hypothetical protein
MKINYKERQREGNIRHLARRSGATWLKGLDGFAISEERLGKLLDKCDELREAARDVLSHHRVKALPLTDTLTPRIERLKAAIIK